MSDKLKPCPCCGSKADYMQVNGDFGGDFGDWHIFCERCPLEIYHSKKSIAIKAWNRRGKDAKS